MGGELVGWLEGVGEGGRTDGRDGRPLCFGKEKKKNRFGVRRFLWPLVGWSDGREFDC